LPRLLLDEGKVNGMLISASLVIPGEHSTKETKLRV